MKRPTAMLAGLLAIAALTAAPAAANPPGPNGQILFGRFDPLQDDTVLFTINPDGSHEHQVLPQALECPHWTPDGSAITTCGFPPDGATAFIDPADGSHRVIPMPDPERLFTACPLLAPRGGVLACESFGETDPGLNGIYTLRATDGGGLTRVTSNPGGDDNPGDFSPDGKRIVFARSGGQGGGTDLLVVKRGGGPARAITPPGMLATSPGDWSPQGNEIIFSRRTSADRRNTLWAVHADGSGLRRIDLRGVACGGPIEDEASKGCFNPRWSPDGRKIVFNIFDDATGENVYTARTDGTDVQQVTFGGNDETPDWGTHHLAR